LGTGSFPEVKCGRGVLLTTHALLVRGHERVELYIYPPSRPHRPVIRITLPFYETLGTCYSTWMTVWYARWKDKYQVSHKYSYFS